LKPGYNQFSVSGLTTGTVTTTVTTAAGAAVLSGSGPLPVSHIFKLEVLLLMLVRLCQLPIYATTIFK
jgi:hypothetical protein